ncbi:hypothetical protein C8R47DRAFT_1169932 [Mycena vitilis]|nr:hypothetical protein C8R47DRAFT_1169932 [Mycena vitilis]
MSANGDALVCENCGTSSFKASSILASPVLAAELREILLSNIPPQPGTEATLRHVIRTAPAELERYDAEIDQLQGLLSRLASERRALAAHLAACRQVSAPVRRLPVELLTEIFEECIPVKENTMIPHASTYGEELNRLAKCSLLGLSQVCSLWHIVAIGTPHLWSTIFVDTSLWGESPKSADRCLSLIRRSLTRSRERPLVLRINCSANIYSPSVLQIFSSHARRWQDVHLTIPREFTTHLKSARGKLPLLDSLAFGTDFRGVNIFKVAPALRKVTFFGRAEGIEKLPWPQLREFHYAGGKGTGSPAALSVAQFLGLGSAFTLDATLEDFNTAVRWPAIVSNIETLTLLLRASQSNANHCLGQVFKAMTLPRLRRLSFQSGKEYTPLIWHQHRFLDFSRRSSLHEHLISLNLNATITDGELLECLSGLPLLEELTIRSEYITRPTHISVTDTLLKGLILYRDGTSLVPRLYFFSLTSFLYFSDAAYWEFLSSRLDSGGHRRSDRPFGIVIRALGYDTRDLGVELSTRISDLVSAGKLKFD